MSGQIFRTPLVQYQDLTGPPQSPADPQTLGLDRIPLYPDQVPGARPRLEGGVATAPLHVPDVTDLVPERSWAVQPVARAPGHRPRLAGLFSAPLHVPDVTDPVTENSWTPIYPDRIRLVPGLAARQQLPWVTNPVTPTLVTTEAGAQIADAMLAQIRLLQYQELTAPYSPIDAAGAAPDVVASLAVYPLRLARRISRAQYVWAEQHFGVIVNVPVMSWTGLYLDPPPRRKVRRQGAGIVEPPWSAFITTITGWNRLLGLERNHLVRGS